MAFDDGTQTGATRSLGVSSGEFQAVRRDTPTFEAVPALVAGSGDTDPTVVGSTPVPNLNYVFDDPNEGEPGRDRMLIHGLWELLLVLAIVGAGIALTDARAGALDGDSLRDLLLMGTVAGLLAVASALALRAGVPNLAVGGAALVASYYAVDHASGAWVGAAGVAIGICAAIGLVQGAVVVVLHVPSWAVSLAVALALAAWVASQPVVTGNLGYDPLPDAYLWFSGVAAVSIGASLVGVVTGFRRGFGRFRPVADPARRRGRTAAMIAAAVTVGSSVLAGLAGVLIALVDTRLDVGTGGADALQAAVLLTATGLGAALLGGTSAYGRRGGIFGTVLATVLLVLTMQWVVETHPTWPVAYVLGAAIGVGLAVTRLVEWFGRPVLLPPRDDDESWMPRVHSLTPTSTPWRPGPTPAGGLWSSDEGWGSPPR